jgi:murein DD-endopeptidase MepM/ murein hydrolase activator NlpD
MTSAPVRRVVSVRSGIVGLALLATAPADAGPWPRADLAAPAPATCSVGPPAADGVTRWERVACTFKNPRGSFGPSAQPTPAPTPSPGQPPVATPSPPPVSERGFAYYSPGDLLAQDRGRGRLGDRRVYLPNIIYPLRLAPGMDKTKPGTHAHMNSQIWGRGGGGWNGKGAAGGGECDLQNYDPMKQRDNFCEVRGWDMPMCPGGVGHQGQDIRPPTCVDNKWEVVAVVDGIITRVTSNTTVTLKASDGTEFDYLHMHPDSITVDEGDTVRQGALLGRVSNFMNGGRQTTRHLHFQVRQSIRVEDRVQRVYVPVFASLIAAYRRAKGIDSGIDGAGNLIVDGAFEIGAPQPTQPTPPFTLWPIPNVTVEAGRAIEPVDVAKSFKSSSPQATVRYAAVNLTPGLKLDSVRGLITGTVTDRLGDGTADDVTTITVTATDDRGATANQSFTLRVTPAAPKVVSPTRPRFMTEGQSLLISAGSAFNNRAGTYRYSATGLPAGMSIDARTGRITGTAAAGSARAVPGGVYAVTVTANADRGASASFSFPLTVEPPAAPPPPAASAPLIVSEIPPVDAFDGQAITPIGIARHFAPGGGGSGRLVYSATGLPPALEINPQTGEIAGTLGANVSSGGTNGAYAVTATAISAEGARTSQSFVIKTRPQPVVVAAPMVNQIYREGELVRLNAGQAFSAAPQARLTFSATGLPAGIAIDPATGLISGSLGAGTSAAVRDGVYTVVVSARDAAGQLASDDFTLTISPPPTEPLPPLVVLELPPVTVTAGTAVPGIETAANFRPATADGGPLQFRAAGLPANLVMDAQSGRISGAVDPATPPGRLSVQVTATDTRNNRATTQTFALTVQPPGVTPMPPLVPIIPRPTDPAPPAPTPAAPPEPPVIMAPLPELTVSEGDTITPIEAHRAFAPGRGGTALRYSARDLPWGLAIDPITGRIVGSVSPSAVAGVYQATITATDSGSGLATSQILTITVRSAVPAPQPPPGQTPSPTPTEPSTAKVWWDWIKSKVTGWF